MGKKTLASRKNNLRKRQKGCQAVHVPRTRTDAERTFIILKGLSSILQTCPTVTSDAELATDDTLPFCSTLGFVFSFSFSLGVLVLFKSPMTRLQGFPRPLLASPTTLRFDRPPLSSVLSTKEVSSAGILSPCRCSSEKALSRLSLPLPLPVLLPLLPSAVLDSPERSLSSTRRCITPYCIPVKVEVT